MKKWLPPASLTLVGAIVTGFSFFSGGGGDLDLEIKKAPFIMPAVHNVYADPEALNGKYYLFKARLTNSSGRTLEDVRVKYRVPGYIDWTELGIIGQMFPGQSGVVACYPKFNDDITKKTTESMEKVEIAIDWDGADENDVVEEEFAFKMMSRNEFVYSNIPSSEISGYADIYDNNDLIPCFVTPSDPVVKYYTQVVQEKVMKGEAASITQKPEDAARFMMSLYEATRMAHMVYSGTKGIPSSADDVSSLVQTLRLPREVITGNTGLCIELSCFYASVMSAAGIDPVIYLIPGHAYPGFRMQGQYYAIEATGINGEGLGGISSAEDAFKKGQQQLQEFMQQAQAGHPGYTVVDVHALNQKGVRSMALSDDTFLKEKVDKIAANFEVMQTTGGEQLLAVVPGNGGGGGNSGDGGGSGGGNSDGGGGNDGGGGGNSDGGSASSGNRTAGPLSFTVPQGWAVRRQPYPQMPVYSLIAESPDAMAIAGVYDVPVGSAEEAMGYLQQVFAQHGSDMRYQMNGNQVEGITYTSMGALRWRGVVARGPSGIRLVAAGALEHVHQQYAPQLNGILSSIR
ncbi:MAG TPA: hypothetical protein PLL25_08085 [Flavobacteriales bacterium]|nr:hypothetical protein [Flavobacteriales bacterium]